MIYPVVTGIQHCLIPRLSESMRLTLCDLRLTNPQSYCGDLSTADSSLLYLSRSLAHIISLISCHLLPPLSNAIDLARPSEGWTDVLLNALILRVHEHAGSECYAAIKARTIVLRKDPLTKKAWIRCDRRGKPEKNSKTTHEHSTSSRLAG